ncbi:MAG: diguanylate cyclase [Gammaproteobacteria bacterium SHHR-1]
MNFLHADLKDMSCLITYRMVVPGIYLLAALLAGVSLYLSLGEIDRDIRSIARERGAVLFQLVELTRGWNAAHGGVYVLVNEDNLPNEYLEHPRRDITDQHGRVLTMINPAYMTRQIAELAQKTQGIRLNITSLKPIRPANRPDHWEAETLRLFQHAGLRERMAYFADGGGVFPGPVHRYMAPLMVKQACLECHEKQGYALGDIRGGISVSMPAADLMAIAGERKTQTMLLYFIGFVLISGLGHLVAWRTHHHLALLESVNREQVQTIAARDQELSAAEKERLIADTVFHNAAEAIMVTDRDNRIIRVNPAFSAITGYTPEQVMGRDPHLLKSGRHEPDFFAAMWLQLETQGRWQGEIWNRRGNGEIYIASMSIATIDQASDLGRYVATFTDITRRKEAEEIILRRANFDKLTQLPNRSLFDDRLDSTLASARRHGRSFALLYVDLDWFKGVNDELGHAAGDALLGEVATRMEGCVREADTVGRLGGDEFAVILADLNQAAEAEEIAVRINQALSQPFELAEGQARISASIGIALYPEDGGDEALLKRQADRALYAAKAAGRNGYKMARQLA